MTGILLLVAGAGCVLSIITGPRYARAWLAATLLGTAAALAAALLLLGGGEDWEWKSRFLVGGEWVHLRLDGISALFLVLVSVIGGVGAVYSREYWSDAEKAHSAPRGRAWWGSLVLSMGLVLLSSNGLHFLIAWEAFAISAYFLITLDRHRKEVRAAGWLYLGASHAGTLCLFAFFATLAARTGSWELGPAMREQAGLAPLFWLALLGFGVKAGLFPLHIWLPSAHANSPSHVSAIMSGVAIKMGIYGIVRFSGWLPAPALAGWVVIAVGAGTAILGVAFALAQSDVKRMLAYCSIENVGVIAVALGCALLGRAQGNAVWGQLALIGGLLHVLNHGLFKALLFLGAGSVLHATGTREMSRLGGLWRNMPWTASLFALGSVAISGLPPLNGFVSEWLVYLGLFDAVTARGPAAWAVVPAIVLLATTGALALACFVKASAVMFLGAPRTKPAAHAHECGPMMRGSMLVLAAACLGIGLIPVAVWPGAARAASAWLPAWNSVAVPESLPILGLFHVALACAAIVVAVRLWGRARRNGMSRELTWDCGYAKPTARMQYSGGSFSRTATAWFDWILRPMLRLRRPRGYHSGEAFLIERVPETVLEKVLMPAGAAIMRASAAARRLQHGRLQAYILYLLAGLGALGALIFAEGML
ncbi:MAG: proton-conducting transporter membrane subunit [Opitutaceae bacterium]|jgi:hydrogenase-4 component B